MFLQLEDGSLLSLGHICKVIPRDWALSQVKGTQAQSPHPPVAVLITGATVPIHDLDFARLKHRFCGESWDTVEVE